MPSSTFPRPEHVLEALESITSPSVPMALVSRSHSGVVKTRNHTSAGRAWTEVYGAINMKRKDTHSFLSYVRWASNTGAMVDVSHPTTPGSGEPHLGDVGTGQSVEVDGADQTGDSISTSGWPASTSDLLLPGTLIKFAGIDRTFEVIAAVESDANGDADIEINPTIFDGGSPDDLAAVTYNDLTIRAVLATQPGMPELGDAFWYSGLTLDFIEAV